MKLFYKRLPMAIVLAFLVFLPFASSSGKVFWSRLLAKSASIFDPAGNWTQIYKCPMAINGARAFLSVYGCDDPLQSVTAKLKQSFNSNKENYFIENENSAQFSSADNNQVSRLLMLSMSGKDQSVIFELSQPLEEISKPPALPSESVVFGRALPAESALTTIIKNEETGAMLETLMTALPPERVCNELSEHLSRNGWKNISPDADLSSLRSRSYFGGVGPSPAIAGFAKAGNNATAKQYFQIYQRKDALCTIMLGHALRENKTCVTILLKEKNGQ